MFPTLMQLYKNGICAVEGVGGLFQRPEEGKVTIEKPEINTPTFGLEINWQLNTTHE